MRTIDIEQPVRIEVAGRQIVIRGGETVLIDGRRKDYYSAYPVVVSEDIAINQLGYTPPKEEKPEEEEVNGS